MARSSSGKSVARAAATGGGATYRGQMPVNWYAALVLIVLVGLASVAFAKYQYDKGPTVVQPTVGTTWYAGVAFDICGTVQPALAASPTTATTGLTTTGKGVLSIVPKSAKEAGNNATLGKFAQGYSGLTLTNTTLKYPSKSVPQYRNGDKCAKGTPDAGKVGQLQARWWVLSTKTKNHQVQETGGTTTTSPADLKFEDRQLITVGFVPAGTKLSKPPSSVILALAQQLTSGSQPVATTTIPGQTTTTAPLATTSTTAAPTTSTKPPSTTTTRAPSTTTTK